jgi:hypothetical protein
MKKKRGKKSNRGRKPNRAVLSGIRPDQETWDEIRCRILWGSTEWPMVALQNLIKNGSQLPSNYLSAPSDVRCSPHAQRPAGVYPLWNKLSYEFERAVLNGDFDWFLRQAKAIKKGGGSPQRAQFYAKVVHLLELAMYETPGLPKNWRPLTDVEREAFPNLRQVPEAVTFTPAGKFTDVMASHIWKAVVDAALEEPKTRSLIEQQVAVGERYFKTKRIEQVLGKTKKQKRQSLKIKKQKRQIIEQTVAENYGFKTQERAMDAIHDIAKRLQVALKKQAQQLPGVPP